MQINLLLLVHCSIEWATRARELLIVQLYLHTCYTQTLICTYSIFSHQRGSEVYFELQMINVLINTRATDNILQPLVSVVLFCLWRTTTAHLCQPHCCLTVSVCPCVPFHLIHEIRLKKQQKSSDDCPIKYHHVKYKYFLVFICVQMTTITKPHSLLYFSSSLLKPFFNHVVNQ